MYKGYQHYFMFIQEDLCWSVGYVTGQSEPPH